MINSSCCQNIWNVSQCNPPSNPVDSRNGLVTVPSVSAFIIAWKWKTQFWKAVKRRICKGPVWNQSYWKRVLLWLEQWSKVQQVDLSRLQAVQSLAYGSLSSGAMPWRTQDPFQKRNGLAKETANCSLFQTTQSKKVEIPYFPIQKGGWLCFLWLPCRWKKWSRHNSLTKMPSRRPSSNCHNI